MYHATGTLTLNGADKQLIKALYVHEDSQAKIAVHPNTPIHTNKPLTHRLVLIDPLQDAAGFQVFYDLYEPSEKVIETAFDGDVTIDTTSHGEFNWNIFPENVQSRVQQHVDNVSYVINNWSKVTDLHYLTREYPNAVPYPVEVGLTVVTTEESNKKEIGIRGSPIDDGLFTRVEDHFRLTGVDLSDIPVGTVLATAELTYEKRNPGLLSHQPDPDEIGLFTVESVSFTDTGKCICPRNTLQKLGAEISRLSLSLNSL